MRLALALLFLPGAAFAQSDWAAEKCRRYARAWDHVSAGEGLTGIGADFLVAHDAFLASGCAMRGRVCPVSAAERALADTLSLMAVAEGMAGSFLPFSCAAREG